MHFLKAIFSLTYANFSPPIRCVNVAISKNNIYENEFKGIGKFRTRDSSVARALTGVRTAE